MINNSLNQQIQIYAKRQKIMKEISNYCSVILLLPLFPVINVI